MAKIKMLEKVLSKVSSFYAKFHIKEDLSGYNNQIINLYREGLEEGCSKCDAIEEVVNDLCMDSRVCDNLGIDYGNLMDLKTKEDGVPKIRDFVINILRKEGIINI